MSGEDGKISSMSPLDALTPDVWFECITLEGTGWVNKKVGFDLLSRVLSLNAITAYDVAVRMGYRGSPEQWLLSLKGKSAYQSAYDSGQFTGTEAEWITALDALYQVQVTDEGKVLVAKDGKGQWVSIDKRFIGLDQVDNTPDMDKPISHDMQAALDGKLDKTDITEQVDSAIGALGFYRDPISGDLIIDEGVLP